MKDTQFMTAKEKERVLKQWRTFLKHGCQRQHFTKRLYTHLMQHCDYIAHYNIHGFYDTYFTTNNGIVSFLTQWDNPSPDTWGNYWITGDYGDINQAMIDVAAEYIPALTQAASTRQRKQDIAEAQTLLARHGISVEL